MYYWWRKWYSKKKWRNNIDIIIDDEILMASKEICLIIKSYDIKKRKYLCQKLIIIIMWKWNEITNVMSSVIENIIHWYY